MSQGENVHEKRKQEREAQRNSLANKHVQASFPTLASAF